MRGGEGNYGKESRKYPRRGTPGCHGGGHDYRAGSCRRGVRGNRDAPGVGDALPVHTLTGWQCPGCGMTHAVVALLRLDIRTAFACNALFPVYGAYCGWLTVSTARQYIRTGKATLPARPVAVHIILLVLALGYGVLRNTL